MASIVMIAGLGTVSTRTFRIGRLGSLRLFGELGGEVVAGGVLGFRGEC